MKCSNCGLKNSDPVALCGECNASLIPSPGKQLEQVTILIADVSGNTAMSGLNTCIASRLYCSVKVRRTFVGGLS